MNKTYKASPVKKWFFLLYLIMPLSRLIIERSFDLFHLIELLLYLCLSVFLYLYHKKKVIIEIKENVLYFYEGVGMHDPSQIETERINSFKREGRNLLVIDYDSNKRFSIEAPKSVLDAFTADLGSLVK